MEGKDWFYGAGIVFTFALSVWNLVVNNRNSQKASFINTVTSQRVKWIEQLRQDIAAYCSLLQSVAYADAEVQDPLKRAELLREIDRLKHVILLRLNPDPDATSDRRIQEFMRVVQKQTQTPSDLETTLGSLIIETQNLIKVEWEKVKDEAEKGRLASTK